MNEKQWIAVVVVSYILWIIIGIIWLFRRKLRFIGRIGRPVTNDELIAMAKSGDEEIKKLRRDTKVLAAVGLVGAFVIYFIKP